jgi:two-component system sensor histidine kinase KdpD
MDRSADERTRQGEVFSIVSHDVRGAVGVILVAVSELLDSRVGSLSEEQRALVRLVSRSSARLTRLAANVSFLERSGAGPLKLAAQPVDARDVARRAVDAFEKSGELGDGRRVRARLQLPDDLARTDADAELLLQATMNLLANAIRVAQKEVVVTVAPLADGKGIAIMVDDDGPGFPAHMRGALFGPGPEAGGIAGAQRELHGLGLFVARGIVHAHGGTLSAELRVGAEGASPGTRVSIALPGAAHPLTAPK